MKQAVLLSIRPEWCELIASGLKTVEVRKTRPKLTTPFRCYIYHTKPKERLLYIMKDGDDCYGYTYRGKPVFIKTKESGGQQVIGEFICDKISMDSPGYINGVAGYHSLVNGSCLTPENLMDYGKWKFLYGWHISDLVIYDKPKELQEFAKLKKSRFSIELSVIEKAPQSWCYVAEV